MKGLKDPRHLSTPLFPKDPKATQSNEEYSLSRFAPILKLVLDAMTKGTLDQTVFPYLKPPLDPNEDLLAAQGGSLRAGRPNWAAAGRRPPENRQRLIVFMAGGATFSESRACYEISNDRGRDVILATSHMLTPQLFIRQVGDLNRDKRQLDLPLERAKPRAPAYLFEKKPPPRPVAPPQAASTGLPSRPTPGPVPPTNAMANVSLGSSTGNGSASHHAQRDDGKLHKEKKRRNFLGMKK